MTNHKTDSEAFTAMGLDRALEQLSGRILSGRDADRSWSDFERLQNIKRDKLFGHKPSTIRGGSRPSGKHRIPA